MLTFGIESKDKDPKSKVGDCLRKSKHNAFLQ